MLLPSLELTVLIVNFLSRNLKIALKTLQIEKFKKHLMITKILLTTRKPTKLRNLLAGAKLETKTILKSPKLTVLFLCSNCVYHKAGYIIPCSSFSFKLTNGKTITWTYKNHFSCDTKDVIYISICKTCNNFHLGQTQDIKQRTAKYKSDVKNLHNSTCRICSEHLRDCNQAEPHFEIFPFYYKTNTGLREYKEKRYILRWKPSLNLHKKWFNVKSSTYYFHMKKKILIVFQICISAPLSLHAQEIFYDTSTSKVAIYFSGGDSDTILLTYILNEVQIPKHICSTS